MINTYRIPFNKASLAGKETQYIQQAIENGHISGDGPFSRSCQLLLQEEIGVEKVLMTTSCTHALEIAALLLDMKPGDEVIIPSFTFVSTVNAFTLRGARPVFIDIRSDTLNLDESQLEELITPRTKAIVPVHYAGVGCEMDTIREIAGRYHLQIIEDNAHGLFGKYKGEYLGTFGSLATQSFHETKNLTCGEGGAILINDSQFIERAEIIREKGTNRSRFFRGQVDKYTWVDLGSSYILSDILAAFLLAQLEAKDTIQDKRKYIWGFYFTHLNEWALKSDVQLPYIPSSCEQSYHMFYILLPTMEKRQALIEHLKRRGILSVFHYQPLHLSDMGKKLGGKPGDCPVTEDISDRLLRLPFYVGLSENDLEYIVDSVSIFV